VIFHEHNGGKDLILNVEEIIDKWAVGCKNFDIPRLEEILKLGLFKYIIYLTEIKLRDLGL